MEKEVSVEHEQNLQIIQMCWEITITCNNNNWLFEKQNNNNLFELLKLTI